MPANRCIRRILSAPHTLTRNNLEEHGNGTGNDHGLPDPESERPPEELGPQVTKPLEEFHSVGRDSLREPGFRFPEPIREPGVHLSEPFLQRRVETIEACIDHV